MCWGPSVRTRVLRVTRQSVSSGLLNPAAGVKSPRRGVARPDWAKDLDCQLGTECTPPTPV